MPRPQVELWWGKKSPEPGIHVITGAARQAMLEPKFREVMAVATDAMHGLGVEMHGRKRVVFWSVRQQFECYGLSTSVATTHMLMKPSELRGRIDYGFRYQILEHEFGHGEREWYFPFLSIGELAVTEGIGYHIAKRATNPVQPWRSRHRPVADVVGEIPLSRIRNLSQGLEAVADLPAIGNKHAEAWERIDQSCGLPLRRAEIVGIAAVGARLEQGDDFPHLLMTPPEEILGFE